MKRFHRVLLVLLPAAMSIWLVGVGTATAGAVAPSATYTCSGTISNATTPPTVDPALVPSGTYSSLVMRPGSFCVVGGAVTVQRGITLGRGSVLLAAEGTVPGFPGNYSGALTVQGPVTVGPDAQFVFYWDGTTSLPAALATINGPVTVESNGFLGLLQSSVRGPVEALNPSAVDLYGSSISGGVSIVGGGGPNDPEGAFISVGLASPYYRYVDVEGNQIGGPFTVIGYAAPGSYYGYAMALLENTVAGPVTLIGNSVLAPGTYSIGSAANVISGPATCMWNSPIVQDLAPSTVGGPILGAQGHLCFG